MRIITIDQNTVDTVVTTLKSNGLVIYPTETLYGIGANPTSQLAINKLTAYKNRPFGKPYSIAVTDEHMASKYVELNSTAREFYRKFLPGPLTVISKGRHILARGVESEDGTLGIRIPDYPLVLDIIKKIKLPITSTSANASYKKRPYKISDILDNLSDKQKKLIDLIIDAGELPHNEPSTVVDTTLDDTVILRQGDIKFKETNEILSRAEENTMNLAKELWQKYEAYKGVRPVIFALQGEMGTGKTIFTKGLAKAMGINDLITSPTFSIEDEYEIPKSKIQFHHFDAWRLEKSDELRILGFEDLIKHKAVISIEWADRVSDIVREFDDEAIILWVKFNYGKNENDRIISWGNI